MQAIIIFPKFLLWCCVAHAGMLLLMDTSQIINLVVNTLSLTYASLLKNAWIPQNWLLHTIVANRK